MKPIALFDIDKTIYNTHSFFQLVDFEVEKGNLSKEIQTFIQNVLIDYKKGNKTYTQAANELITELATKLKNKNYELFYKNAKEFFIQNENNFYKYFTDILPKLKTTHDIYIITTNVQYAAKALVDIYNLSGYVSTELEVIDNVFTGNVKTSLANGKGIIKHLIEKYGKQKSIAVGDSNNDIGMLELVENPICINPDEELKTHAIKNKWTIVNQDNIYTYLSNLLTK